MKDTLTILSKNHEALKGRAKEIIASARKIVENIMGASIESAGDTWLRFMCCGREFLLRCFWKVKG